VAAGSDRVIGHVKKQSTFSSGAAFFSNAIADKQTYFITIEPNVDAALLVSLAVLADEMWHDNDD
jgi:hypothetical protein